jgi:YbgC/YbaW family acyl-CoA thioester hydrolase
MGAADGWAYSQVDRVRYADLDARGHLNNVALLTFFEAARIMYLRRRFSEQDAHDLILVSQHIDYRAPGGLDDDLRTLLRPLEIRTKSFRLGFEIRREEDGTLVAEGSGVYVGYDYERSASRELSGAMCAQLQEDVTA